MTSLVMREFTYLEPKTAEEAVSILSQYGGTAKPLAGGTDLLIQMKLRTLKPACLVNVKKIPGFNVVRAEAEALHIGAATTIRVLERSDLVRKQYPLLSDVIQSFGSVQVRNMATIGGNICNASPAADFATSLLALYTQVKIVGPNGVRMASLDGLFTRPDQCALKPDELLAEIMISYPKPGTGSAFMKLSRVKTDLAKVSVAVVLTLKGGVCEDVRIAMGAVAPTPMRAMNAEAALTGQSLTDEAIEGAAEAASAESKPLASVGSTEEYKREAVRAMVKRCLNLAMKRGDGGA